MSIIARVLGSLSMGALTVWRQTEAGLGLTLEVLGNWRQGKPWQTWSIDDFLLALGRLGGNQNRKADGLLGWLTL